MEADNQSGLIADGVDGMILYLTYGNLGENAFTANITFSLPSTLEFVAVLPVTVRTCINALTSQRVHAGYWVAANSARLESFTRS